MTHLLLSIFQTGPLSTFNTFLSVLLGIGLIVSWVLIFQRWDRCLLYLLCYIPISGVISLTLAPAQWPKLYADLSFILPGYLAFRLQKKDWRTDLRLPRTITGSMAALATL